MINNISWGDYWFTLLILTLIYYVYVLLVYYRSNLVRRIQPAFFSRRPEVSSSSDDDELLPVVQSLTDEMIAYLEQASKADAVKPEIIFALQRIAKKYKEVKESPYQSSVNRLLQFECENKCAVHLSEEEIKQVWMDQV